MNVDKPARYSISVYPFCVNDFKGVGDIAAFAVAHERLTEVVDIVCHDGVPIKCYLSFMLCNELSPELQLLGISEDVEITYSLYDEIADVPDSIEATPYAKTESENEGGECEVFIDMFHEKSLMYTTVWTICARFEYPHQE